MPSDLTKFRRYEILGTPFNLPLVAQGQGSEIRERLILEATLLFTQKGYAAVTLKEVAEQAEISPAEIHRHFATKDELWNTVINHTVDLYLLYFRRLDEAINKAESFEEVLEILFLEPKRLSNHFTCFAFGLVQAEQFHDRLSWDVFRGAFLDYSVKFITDRFDRCVERGQAPPFDTRTVAVIIMNSVFMGINIKIHEIIGRPIPYDPAAMIANLQQFILTAIGLKPAVQEPSAAAAAGRDYPARAAASLKPGHPPNQQKSPDKVKPAAV